MKTVPLRLLEGGYGVARLGATAAVPTWADGPGVVAVTRTPDELSIVCRTERIPADVTAQRDWVALRVAGTLDFALTGILNAVTAPLAEAGISVFALSTYDTDYLLVRAASLDEALRALTRAGHNVADAASQDDAEVPASGRMPR